MGVTLMKKILALALLALVGTADVSAMNMKFKPVTSTTVTDARLSKKTFSGLRKLMHYHPRATKLIVGTVVAAALVGTAAYAYSVGTKADEKASALEALKLGASTLASQIGSGIASAAQSTLAWFRTPVAPVNPGVHSGPEQYYAQETARLLKLKSDWIAAQAAAKLQACNDNAGKAFEASNWWRQQGCIWNCSTEKAAFIAARCK